MTQRNTRLLMAAVAVTFSATIGAMLAVAAPPSVRQASIDFAGSGYVTPAGQIPPSQYRGGVMPVGYYESLGGCTDCGAMGCDGNGCDSGGFGGGGLWGGGLCGSGSCGSGSCGGGACGGGCGLFGCGGLLGKLRSGCNCGACGQMSGLRHLCLFCGGSGCAACQMFSGAAIGNCLGALLPYGEAGLCAQRWYDLSAEAVFLGHSNGSLRGPVATLGTAPAGPTVLSLGDADAGDDLEAGMRLSAAMIFGAGGNLEVIYMGNNQWDGRAVATDDAGGLFSFVSDFGTDPVNGFDDTDRSEVQSVAIESEFHTGEFNYRRRTMGPYCRFQGSWLIGLRYLRFENGLLYSAANDTNVPVRFFSSHDRVKNDLFGPQAGFDLWYNWIPGVNLGLGMKGAWVQNDLDRTTVLRGNSIDAGAPGSVALSDTERDTTVMGEFEAKLVYKLSHSWAFRTAYYAVAVDDIGFAITDRETIRGVVSPDPMVEPDYHYHSLVVQGFSFGAEYTW